MTPRTLPLAALALAQVRPDGWQWVDALAAVAQIVLALALLVLAGAVIGLVIAIRKARSKLEPLLGQVQAGVQPVLKHAADVGENVNYISAAVRGDVERLSATVTAATEQLHRASAVAEARVSDFNALLHVVQEEAENLFIGTASTVRGVRAGADAFRRYPLEPDRSRGRREDDDLLADDLLDDPEDAFADDDELYDDGHHLTDDQITDEELEIRIEAHDARRRAGGEGGGARPG